MDWWQTVLIVLGAIASGAIVGGLLSYLLLRLPFKIRLGNGLIPLNILTWLLILVITVFPLDILRVVLGIATVIFFPGYALLVALFVRDGEMSGITRVALSFVLSMALVALTAFILNYTPWGITLESVLYSVASLILIASVVGWFRSARLAKDSRFVIEFEARLPTWGKGAWDRLLPVLLVLVMLGTLGVVSYVLANPRAGETFTEFYILGAGGKATDYPKELELGSEGKVIVGIVNHEGKECTYSVAVIVDGRKSLDIGPVMLVDEQKWEAEVTFVPEVAGDHQKVEFWLYKSGESEPYLEPLHLWIDVRE